MILLAMFALATSPWHFSWPWWAWLVVFLCEWGNSVLNFVNRRCEMKQEALKLQNILEKTR